MSLDKYSKALNEDNFEGDRTIKSHLHEDSLANKLLWNHFNTNFKAWK